MTMVVSNPFRAGGEALGLFLITDEQSGAQKFQTPSERAVRRWGMYGTRSVR